MPFQKMHPLQRLRFSDDQLLTASDLNDYEEYETTLRRMHVRSLHNTWGVALGFYLSLNNTNDQVLAGPGLAYDALGREALLSETLALPAPYPPASSSLPLAYDLAVSQRSLSEILAGRNRRTACTEKTPAESVAFRWVLAGEQNSPQAGLLAKGLRLGIEVPLGRFIYDPVAKNLSGPVLGFRQFAHPLLRPHIGFGQVRFSEMQGGNVSLSYSKEVQTGDYGFHSTPQYFVFLPENKLLNKGGALCGLSPILSVTEPQYDRFTLHCIFVSHYIFDSAIIGSYRDALLDNIGDMNLYWVGVEMVAGSQPQPDPNFIFSIIGNLVINVGLYWSSALAPFLIEKEIKG